MDLGKLYEEKQKSYQQLLQELNRVRAYEQQLTNELLRLEGELRLLDSLIAKRTETKKDVISEEIK